jgi:peptidoglycan/LPS O-acetylase OafA/YrhL
VTAFYRKMSASDITSSSSSERFVFIDNLRGIACLCIVIYHCRYYEPFKALFTENFPIYILKPLDTLGLAVPLFFIISGFVIAHSLRNNDLTAPSVLNFILRRQIRLDPPYWLALIFQYLLNIASQSSFYSLTFWSVLANIFYLQGLLNLPSEQIILGVSWTLCLEIQFYFAFLLILWIGKRLTNNSNASSLFSPITIAILFITGVTCLILRSFVAINTNLVGYWHFFVIGVLCYLIQQNTISRRFLWFFLGVYVVLIIGFPNGSNIAIHHSRLGMTIVAAQILIIYFLGERQKKQLTAPTPHPWLQFFAKISYSLYLVHSPIIHLVYTKGFLLTGHQFNYALFYFVLAAVISIIVATVFQRLIEQPAVEWSRRLRMS